MNLPPPKADREGTMLTGDSDLRRAMLAGFSLWAVDGLACVEVRGEWLRYDPALSSVDRGRRVLAILRGAQRPPGSTEK